MKRTKECDLPEAEAVARQPSKLQGATATAPRPSVYIQKKAREGKAAAASAGGGISLPKNPFGFDSALASQVATKAKLFTGFTKKKAEEVFGDSD